jgi:hypothetical protein
MVEDKLNIRQREGVLELRVQIKGEWWYNE